MKKLLLMAVLATVAGTSMAQDKAIKKAQSLFNESATTEEYKDANGMKKMRSVVDWDKVREAQETLTPALTNEKTKDFALYWKVQADIDQRYMTAELNKAASQEPLDTLKFYEYVTRTVDANHKVMENDKKGVYKQFAQINLEKFRVYYLYCGQFFSNNNDPARSFEAFSRWLDYGKNYPLLPAENLKDSQGDTDPNMIAYYAALTAYQSKQYEKMNPYRDMAMAYEKDAATVRQLYLASTLEQGDTTEWLRMGEQFALEGSAGDGIVQNILAHYFEHKDNDKVLAFADKIIAQRPADKLGPYAKGLVAMNAEKYEDAIVWFDKALEIDPDYFDALYQAGACYLNIAYTLNDALATKKMTKAQNDQALIPIKDNCRKAEPYFVHIREIRPDEPMRWAPRLRQIYYIIDDKEKLKEVEPFCEL